MHTAHFVYRAMRDVWWWCRHNESMQCGEWQLAAGYKFIMHPIKAVFKNKFDFGAGTRMHRHTHTHDHTPWARRMEDVATTLLRNAHAKHWQFGIVFGIRRTWIIWIHIISRYAAGSGRGTYLWIANTCAAVIKFASNKFGPITVTITIAASVP